MSALVTDQTTGLSFDAMVAAIGRANADLSEDAARAVNQRLTVRNWLIGCYIAEYELRGTDRATYGDQLVLRLAERLRQVGVSRADARELRRYRRFYDLYPGILDALGPDLAQALKPLLPEVAAADRAAIRSVVAPAELVRRLSFTHVVELLKCDDPTKRAFYEVECIRGDWSVRELKRQIASLYYERAGLSTDKAALAAQAQVGAERAAAALTIRDPYVFEFLGLRPQEVMSETQLEDQLLDKLQEFLLELGHGFCFEARQRRILIGDTHCFVDLVFYHRVLKCHVLVELKIGAFSHENIGQLNTYVSWYRRHMMTEGDNPPIGILLCTAKDHALVEYALAGIDNGLFVSKYLLELPEKEAMQRFIEEQLASAEIEAVRPIPAQSDGAP